MQANFFFFFAIYFSFDKPVSNTQICGQFTYFDNDIYKFLLKQAINTQVVSAQLASDSILADLLRSLVLFPNMV